MRGRGGSRGRRGEREEKEYEYVYEWGGACGPSPRPLCGTLVAISVPGQGIPMRKRTCLYIAALITVLLWPPTALWAKDSIYEKDMAFALDELEENCGHFFKAKGINWKKVRKAFKKDAKKVKTDEDHMLLMVRLLARLNDGHAAVRPLTRGEEIPVHESFKEPLFSPGMYWCRVGKKVYAKVSGSEAHEVGIESGCEILKAEDMPVMKWLEQRVETLRDRHSFSTDHQAMFYACHWGLSGPRDSRFKVEFKDQDGKTRKRTITIHRARAYVDGPAHVPEGLAFSKDLKYGKVGDFGYIHVRRCKNTVVAQMDEALEKLEGIKGLVLDFRGNSGGGFDHEALMGRFIPEGKSISFAKRYEGAGPVRFGGPVVVIVDGTTVSAGETASGIFKEDGPRIHDR